MTVDDLRKSKDIAQVAFTEFTLSTREYPDSLFCFFEGKDNPYYVPRIKHYTSNYYPISCKGREKVIKVHSLISEKSEYNSYKKAFFIDRDFHKPLEQVNPPIFETPCYSIENFYVSVGVFKEILLNSFHLTEYDNGIVIENCLSLYEQRQAEFHKATLLFNAWYACLIEIRDQTGQTTGVTLDEKFPRDFVKISLESVTSSYNQETIQRKFPNAIPVDQNTLNNKIQEFENCDQCKTFRGKYEMQFLTTIIRLLIEDSINPKSVINSRINFDFSSNLTNDQAINVFSGYAETPESLKEYLTTVLSYSS